MLPERLGICEALLITFKDEKDKNMDKEGKQARIYSEEYKAEVVSRFLSSGMRQKEFSEVEGISRSALYSWMKKGQGESRGKFIEVPVARREERLESRIELELARGITLRIWG